MDYLKDCLTSEPILTSQISHAHFPSTLMLLTWALMQKDDMGRDIVIAFASRILHKAERPYSVPEKECLRVIWALKQFRPYIEGLHVTIYTDHNSLRWLMNCPNPLDESETVLEPTGF